MTGRERFLAALKGHDVDRPPIWLREGMNIFTNANADSFLTNWKEDKIYKTLIDDIKEDIDIMGKAKLGQGNRFLMISDDSINIRTELIGNERILHGEIKTSKKILNFTKKQVEGQETTWDITHPAKSLDDLVSILNVPFTLDINTIKQAAIKYSDTENRIGERGVTNVFLSSPMVCISAACEFEDFFI